MRVPNSEEIVSLLRQTVTGMTPECEAMAAFNESNLVIRVRFDDTPAQVTFDGRMGEVFWTETPGRADLELNLAAIRLHEVMVGSRSLRESITDGTIRIKGNIFRALSFAELLQAAKPFYQAQLKATNDV